jgi:hypothetical protein
VLTKYYKIEKTHKESYKFLLKHALFYFEFFKLEIVTFYVEFKAMFQMVLGFQSNKKCSIKSEMEQKPDSFADTI